jgi:hypothetical protein
VVAEAKLHVKVQADKLAVTIALPFLKGGPLGSARTETGMTCSTPVHLIPGMAVEPWAISLPAACSTVTWLIGNNPLGQDTVTVVTTSTFAVKDAVGSMLTVTPLLASATVAEATVMIAKVGTTSAKRKNLGTGCLLSLSAGFLTAAPGSQQHFYP